MDVMGSGSMKGRKKERLCIWQSSGGQLDKSQIMGEHQTDKMPPFKLHLNPEKSWFSHRKSDLFLQP